MASCRSCASASAASSNRSSAGKNTAALNSSSAAYEVHLWTTCHPPGASPAPLWGRVDHVRELFGDRVTGFTARQQELRTERFTTGAEFRDFMKQNYGPTIAVYRFLGDDAAKVAALDDEMAALGERFLVDGVMEWEYLLVTAQRA